MIEGAAELCDACWRFTRFCDRRMNEDHHSVLSVLSEMMTASLAIYNTDLFIMAKRRGMEG